MRIELDTDPLPTPREPRRPHRALVACLVVLTVSAAMVLPVTAAPAPIVPLIAGGADLPVGTLPDRQIDAEVAIALSDLPRGPIQSELGCDEPTLYAIDFDIMTGHITSLYMMSPSTGAVLSSVGVTGIGPSLGLEMGYDGLLYTVSSNLATPANALYSIHPATGESKLIAPLGLGEMFEGDIALDPNDPGGPLYGVTGGLESRLFRVDLATGEAEVVGTIPGQQRDISYLAFDGSSRLWGIDGRSGGSTAALLQIDTSDASIPLEVPLSQSLGAYGGMDLDPVSGSLYLADSGQDGSDAAFVLNTSTGQLTPIGPTGIRPYTSGLVWCTPSTEPTSVPPPTEPATPSRTPPPTATAPGTATPSSVATATAEPRPTGIPRGGLYLPIALNGNRLGPRLDPSRRPANDDLARAVEIASLPFSDTRDTAFADTEPDESLSRCEVWFGDALGVWYRFTAERDAFVRVTTEGSDYNTILSVWTGQGRHPLSGEVACNDDARPGGDYSSLEWQATAGASYYIRASGFAAATGQLRIAFRAEGDAPAMYGGIPLTPLPGTELEQAGEALVVTSSNPDREYGFDGDLGEAGGISLQLDVEDGAMPGDFFEVANAAPGAPALWSRATSGSSGIDITSGTTSPEASREPFTVDAYLAGEGVASVSGVSGTLASADAWPSSARIDLRSASQLPQLSWTWSEPSSLEIPGSDPVMADHIVITAARQPEADVVSTLSVLAKGPLKVIIVEPPVVVFPISACDEEAVMEGRLVIFPDELDPDFEPVYSDVDSYDGTVDAIYGSKYDTDYDLWYENDPCHDALGEPEPPPGPDIAAELKALGFEGTPEELAETLADLEQAIVDDATSPRLPEMTALDGPFPDPPLLHEADPAWPLGGRDVVFVHGLRTAPIISAIEDASSPAYTGWNTEVSAACANGLPTPFACTNPEFYGSLPGYWYTGAEGYWNRHIQRLHSYPGGKDTRYLVVAWPATERIYTGAHAMLAQIYDAMMTGEGVQSFNNGLPTEGFCQPNCVIVSHSAGALLTDAAMSMAASGFYPGSAISQIPDHIKAHVALHGAFSGSRYATAAVAVGSGLSSDPDVCLAAWMLMEGIASAMGSSPTLSLQQFCSGQAQIQLQDTILKDLVPSISQLEWGQHKQNSPLPTVVVAGAHPGVFSDPSKWLSYHLLFGLDDGVLNADSQCANPNAAASWPSRYVPWGLYRDYDLGIHFRRAVSFFAHQRMPTKVAAACTPYLSTTGMRQPYDGLYSADTNPLNRYNRHYSYIQTASDHMVGPTSPKSGRRYEDGPTGSIGNWEEVRVIHDNAMYASDTRFADDTMPLLTQAPTVDQTTKGRKVTFRIKFLGMKVEKTWWIWKRVYHRIGGSSTLDELDYVYQGHLLRMP